MNSKTIWATLLLIVVVGGVGYMLMNSKAPAHDAMTDTMPAGESADNQWTDTPTDDVSVDVGLGEAIAVHYNGSTFTPSSLTVKKGDTVTFIDDVGATMWLASDAHPSHTGYDGTSRSEHCAPGYTGVKPFDQCGKGASYTFTFNSTGTWQYHDHLNSSAGGTIVVQ